MTQIDRATDLASCPFCGGEAKYIQHYWYEGNSSGDYVTCTKCTTRNHSPRLVSDPSAIAAWNRRARTHKDAEIEALLARVKALEGALEPFAREAEAWPEHCWDGYKLGNASTVNITIGDLRRASAALSQEPTK